MLKKSTHFNQRWREELAGRPPSTAKINQWIKEQCVIIQKYRELFTARGYRFDLMALYWEPQRGIIFKVDQRRKKIVTVLTEHTLQNGRR